MARSRIAAAAWFAASLLTLLAGNASAAISAEEQQLLDRLDAKRTLADIRRLSQEVVSAPSGLGAGSVVSGSPEEQALAADLAASLGALGLEVRVEEFPVRSYRYGPMALAVAGEPVTAISLHASGGTFGRRDGVDYRRGNESSGQRLHAPLVDAGGGYESDYAHAGDVRGKIVLVHRELRDWPPAQISEAVHHGAVAIVFYGHSSSAEQPDALRQDSMWGHEAIPAAAISHRSGESLRARLAKGPLDATLENRIDVSDGTSRNVIGTLRGTEAPDEWVVVSAHYDRWFQGALDNTSGAAAVLEMARAFTGSGLKPRRSMLFIAAGSEEAGLEDPERDWLAGSHAFVLRHPEVLRNAALIANIDLLGWTAPSGKLVATADAVGAAHAVLGDLGYEPGVTVKTPSGSTTDAWNFGVVGGATVIHIDRFTPAYYPLYHTQLDVARPEFFENLPADLRILTLSLWRAASASRLPLALTALADEVSGEIARDAPKVPEVSFAGLKAALKGFRQAAAAVEALDEPARLDAANRVRMATRHALVPWLYASNGDYEQVARTTEYANRAVLFHQVETAVRAGRLADARKQLAGLYEGRQCQRLAPAVYEFERGFWATDGGWASRFAQQAPPPPPMFERACQALAAPTPPTAPIAGDFHLLRLDSVQSVAEAVALMTAKLRAATATLEQFSSGPPGR